MRRDEERREFSSSVDVVIIAEPHKSSCHCTWLFVGMPTWALVHGYRPKRRPFVGLFQASGSASDESFGFTLVEEMEQNVDPFLGHSTLSYHLWASHQIFPHCGICFHKGEDKKLLSSMLEN